MKQKDYCLLMMKQTNFNKIKIRLTAPVSSFSEEILPLNKLK